MKKVIFAGMLLMFSVACVVSQANVNASVSINKWGSSFYLSIGDYFQAPQKEVIIVRDRGISDEELPVVFFIAQRAHVAPAAVMDLRLKGKSWMDITLRFGLGPEIYYVPVNNPNYGPYGHAYGHYKNKNKKNWKRERLGDDDIVNLVNLKFMSEHYKTAPETIMKMRQDNRGFHAISDDMEKKSNQNRQYDKGAKDYKGNPASQRDWNQQDSGHQQQDNGNHGHNKGGNKHGQNGDNSQKEEKHGGQDNNQY